LGEGMNDMLTSIIIKLENVANVIREEFSVILIEPYFRQFNK
jgi:hypothetical protein